MLKYVQVAPREPQRTHFVKIFRQHCTGPDPPHLPLSRRDWSCCWNR